MAVYSFVLKGFRVKRPQRGQWTWGFSRFSEEGRFSSVRLRGLQVDVFGHFWPFSGLELKGGWPEVSKVVLWAQVAHFMGELWPTIEK